MKLFSMVVGPIETNCYVVADGDGNAAVIDPGANGGGIAGRILNRRMDNKAVEKLFMILMAIIICISIYNVYNCAV